MELPSLILSTALRKRYESLPFYHSVPKDLRGNLAFRRKLVEAGSSDPAEAKRIWMACSRDPLFYINTMVWTFSPKEHPDAPILPMITWDYQDVGLLEINQAIDEGYNLLEEKSRDMGASWMNLIIFEWRWKFKELQTFLVLSRKEDMVDKPEEPDCLFWKIDFIIRHQPRWLNPGYNPEINRNSLMIKNPNTGSTIAGDSTTGDVARGGRKTAILLDEFASVPEGNAVLAATKDAANCRIFNSTPKGIGNAFYKQRQLMLANSDGKGKVLRFHWSMHPEKAEGLYYDPDTNKARSAWYDKECKERHPMEIAQELDIDYLGSDHQYYEAQEIDRVQKLYVRPPVLVGNIDYDPITLEIRGFVKNAEGALRLWMQLDGKGFPAKDRNYVLGADVASGTGASNSVLAGGDAKTGEKVLEYANPRISPDDFAKYGFVLAKWLGGADGRGARFIWEANGPGQPFGNVLVKTLGYKNIYWRTNEKSIKKKETDIPGWWTTPDSKLALMSEHRRAMKANEYVERSFETCEECRAYIYTTQNTVIHSAAANTSDPSGANANHGDRAFATALMWHVLKSMRGQPVVVTEMPENCFAARRSKSEAGKKKKEFY